MSDLTAADVATQFGCAKRKVREEARRNGIGYNLGGRAGWRFTEADVDKLRKAMAPAAPVKKRRVA
jgi:hypothetical protein